MLTREETQLRHLFFVHLAVFLDVAINVPHELIALVPRILGVCINWVLGTERISGTVRTTVYVLPSMGKFPVSIWQTFRRRKWKAKEKGGQW